MLLMAVTARLGLGRLVELSMFMWYLYGVWLAQVRGAEEEDEEGAGGRASHLPGRAHHEAGEAQAHLLRHPIHQEGGDLAGQSVVPTTPIRTV